MKVVGDKGVNKTHLAAHSLHTGKGLNIPVASVSVCSWVPPCQSARMSMQKASVSLCVYCLFTDDTYPTTRAEKLFHYIGGNTY